MALNIVQSYGGVARMGAVGSAFAADISKRISVANGLNASGAAGQEQSPEQADKIARLNKLESALSATVAYMSKTHGDQAASAMIGLIYKSIGDGGVTEASLGNALLDVTRFIDSNFGVDKGDAFMNHLNGSLNDSMNEFFDNGVQEKFIDAAQFQAGFAASGNAGGAGGSGGAESLMEQIIKEYTDSVKAMLEEARQKAREQGTLQNSPLAAYAPGQDLGIMQGVLKDVVV